MRFKNTASRSGSTTSTLVTATPAASAASSMAGSRCRPSLATRCTESSAVAALGDPLHAPARLGEAFEVSGRAERDAVLLTELGHQLAPRSLCDQAAVVDDPDAIADPLGLLHVVRRVHDGQAFSSESLHPFQDGVAALGVDADRRLVEHEQLRVVEQARRDVHAPFHAA